MNPKFDWSFFFKTVTQKEKKKTPLKYNVAANVVSNYCSPISFLPEQPQGFLHSQHILLPPRHWLFPVCRWPSLVAGWIYRCSRVVVSHSRSESSSSTSLLCGTILHLQQGGVCIHVLLHSFPAGTSVYFFFPAGEPRRLSSCSILEGRWCFLPSQVKSVRSHFIQLSCSSLSEEYLHFGL